MKTLNVPISNMTNLKKSPKNVFNIAKEAQTGVYIFNRDEVTGVVMDVEGYEKMVKKLDDLQEKLWEAEVAQRLNKPVQTIGVEATEKLTGYKDTPLDPNDGWE